MIETNEQKLYASPQLKVVEIKARQMVCASLSPKLTEETDGAWS